MLAVSSAALEPGVASAAPHGGAPTYTCSTGTFGSPTLIPAGTYGSVTVTGNCYLQGSYTVTHGLTVGPDALLDAALTFGESTTTCDVFMTVNGGVRVESGAALYLGNSVGTAPCTANSNDVVDGGLRATDAQTVVVHGTTINGGVSVSGGGGGTSCNGTPFSPFGPFTDVEDSTIHGTVSLSDVSTCWMGFIRNTVSGSVSVRNNTMGDPDAIEIGLNTIHGSLACSGNALAFVDPAGGGVPTNFFDGAGPNPNTVSGQETGQCAGL